MFTCPDFRVNLKQFRHPESLFYNLLMGPWSQLINWVMLWMANASNLPSIMPWSHFIVLHPPLWANAKSMKCLKNHPPASTTHDNTKCATKQAPYYPWSHVVLSVFQLLELKAGSYRWHLEGACFNLPQSLGLLLQTENRKQLCTSSLMNERLANMH